MPPRIIQWLPVAAFDEVYLLPRAGQHDAFAKRARELGPHVQVSHRAAEIYTPGTNIDGGWFSVGDEQPIVRMADASIDDIARSTAELIDYIEPTRYLVRDHDGTRAVHVAEDIEIVDLADWRRHLVTEAQQELLVEAVTEAIAARGGVPRADDLADLEDLVRITPARLEPHLFLARLYLQLARHDDAEREARAILELDERDYRKSAAYSVLGDVAEARGDREGAFAQHELAFAKYRQPQLEIAAGVAALDARELETAWTHLAPRHRGRALVDLGAAMCALDRPADARAFLRCGLECEPDLLAPVAENQWPKPPEIAWTSAHPQLAALVAASIDRLAKAKADG